MISGEPIPVLKEKGSKVIGATINKNSILNFRATKIGKDTVLSQIIKLVEEAQGSNLKSEDSRQSSELFYSHSVDNCHYFLRCLVLHI